MTKVNLNRHTVIYDQFIPSFIRNVELPSVISNEVSAAVVDVDIDLCIQEGISAMDSTGTESDNLQYSVEQSSSNTATSENTASKRNVYFSDRHQIEKKTKHLESVISALKSPVKKQVLRNLNTEFIPDLLVVSDASSLHEASVINSLIDYLRDLTHNRQYPVSYIA